MVEYKQRLLGQSHQELNCEERIAVSLLMHELRKRPGNLSLTVKRIGDELPDIVRLEWSKHDLLHPPSRLADHFECPHQRVRGIDLVAPVGANQHQMPYLRLGDQVRDQFKSRRIQPLKVVEEQDERVFGPGEHAEESPKHQLEACLPVLWRQVGKRRLLTDDESKLGDQVDHELAARADGLQ